MSIRLAPTLIRPRTPARSGMVSNTRGIAVDTMCLIACWLLHHKLSRKYLHPNSCLEQDQHSEKKRELTDTATEEKNTQWRKGVNGVSTCVGGTSGERACPFIDIFTYERSDSIHQSKKKESAWAVKKKKEY